MTSASGGYSYIYDGDGNRVEKCTAGSTAGTCAASPTGTLYWVDTGGNNIAESDLTGAMQEEYVFFGKRIARRDVASGSVHYYFSEALGRFVIPDWSAGEDPVPYASLASPQTLNLYGYVMNDPISKIDPTGHELSFDSPQLESRFNQIASESPSFKNEMNADKEDDKIHVRVVERGVKQNAEHSTGDSTIGFRADGQTDVTVNVDSYRTDDGTIAHEVGHVKDARTNREQLKKDALKTAKDKGGPNQLRHDDRPEEKRADDFKGIETEQLAYFALSLVWRSSVRRWRTLGLQTTGVSLGKFEEPIRKYLAGEETFPKRVVVVTVCVCGPGFTL